MIVISSSLSQQPEIMQRQPPQVQVRNAVSVVSVVVNL